MTSEQRENIRILLDGACLDANLTDEEAASLLADKASKHALWDAVRDLLRFRVGKPPKEKAVL